MTPLTFAYKTNSFEKNFVVRYESDWLYFSSDNLCSLPVLEATSDGAHILLASIKYVLLWTYFVLIYVCTHWSISWTQIIKQNQNLTWTKGMGEISPRGLSLYRKIFHDETSAEGKIELQRRISWPPSREFGTKPSPLILSICPT